MLPNLTACTGWRGDGTLPAPPLEVPETELLLQFLVVPLDAPAQLRQRDEPVESDVFRNGRQPEPGRFLLVRRPFEDEPFLVAGRTPIVVAVRGTDANAREARARDVGAALPPGDRLPGLGRSPAARRAGYPVPCPCPVAASGREREASWRGLRHGHPSSAHPPDDAARVGADLPTRASMVIGLSPP